MSKRHPTSRREEHPGPRPLQELSNHAVPMVRIKRPRRNSPPPSQFPLHTPTPAPAPAPAPATLDLTMSSPLHTIDMSLSTSLSSPPSSPLSVLSSLDSFRLSFSSDPYSSWSRDYSLAHYLSFLEREARQAFHSSYFPYHPDLNPAVRRTVVDWMVQCHEEFRFVSDTLFLSVRLLDRVLYVEGLKNKEREEEMERQQFSLNADSDSLPPTPPSHEIYGEWDKRCGMGRGMMQKVALVCVIIACKYEEMLPPPVEDFVAVAASRFSKLELVRAELEVLQMLDYELTLVTPKAYVKRFLDMVEALKLLDPHAPRPSSHSISSTHSSLSATASASSQILSNSHLDTLSTHDSRSCLSAPSSASHSTKVLHYLTSYLLTLSLYEEALLAHRPSRVAAAAVLVALHTLAVRRCWPRTLSVFTECDFNEREFLECVTMVSGVHERRWEMGVSAVNEMYKGEMYGRVALLPHMSMDLEQIQKENIED